MLKRIFFSLICLLAYSVAQAQLTVDTLATDAFNGYINGVSFQHDAITTYKGYQYAVYWSQKRFLTVARKPLSSTRWETVELPDYAFETDNAHYDISLGISPLDGTLHLSFYQWSSRFNYRKTLKNVLDNPSEIVWQVNLFSPVVGGLQNQVMTPTTYPQFVTAPNGKLLLLLRHGESGAGDAFLYEYDGLTSHWEILGKFMDGLATNINPYFNGLHFDAKGRLHTTWVWRATPDATTNFDLHYAYSDDVGRTWYGNNGQLLGITGKTPITQNTPGIRVWSIGQNRGLINQEAQAVDSEGRVSMLMSHLPDNAPSSNNFENNRLKARVYHYFRALNGQWSRTELPGSSFSFDRNKIAADRSNNLYAIINRDGIYRATPNGQWKDWQLVEPINDQSLFAEVQVDRQRLAQDNILNFIHISNKGALLYFEYQDKQESSPLTRVGGGPEGYIFCALEGETCTFSGRRDLAFGASGQFMHKSGVNSILCNKDNFGEPLKGVVKRCYYSAQNSQINDTNPQAYLLCADENGLCMATELSQIAYGNQGRFNYRLVDETVKCTASTFGASNTSGFNQCFIRTITSTAVNTSAGQSSQSSLAASASSLASSRSSLASSNQSASTSSKTSSTSSSVASGGRAGLFNLGWVILLGLGCAAKARWPKP